MNEQILINVTPQETRVAVTEQGAVQELHVERDSSRGLVGNIYLGRVCRVLPGMQSAFVEIGLTRAAFLHVADIWSARNGTGTERPIERILSEGQTILVQVVKDPIGSKGARLSTQVSIAGRLLVYLPQDPHIGISQRIEDEAERELLREKVHGLIPEGESGGVIVRTEAEMKQALEEIARLRARAAEVAVPGNREYNPGWHTALDLPNLLTVSEAVTRAALERRESRGAQFRVDYPDKDPEFGKVNIVVRKEADGGMGIVRVPIVPPAPEHQAIIEEMK